MSAAAEDNDAWPVEITLDPTKRWLTVAYDSGASFRLPAELLRVESPSAEVQGHGGDQKTIVPGKRTVTIAALEPVGNYAVRIVFSDGHDTGLYSWRYLHELGTGQERVWQTYLDALAARGLSRDR